MLSLFLARRFFRPTKGDETRSRRASSLGMTISIAGLAVGLAVMLISICVVRGFQNEVGHKLVGFVSHIEVLNRTSLGAPELYPIRTTPRLLAQLRAVPGVERVQTVSSKMGILKTNEHFKGISLRGVGADYDLSFLKENLTQGRVPAFSDTDATNQIVISEHLAEDLGGLRVGDKVYSYYFANTIKQRRLTIAGLYNTHLPLFDDFVVWTDRATVNQLNSWTADQASAIEVNLHSMNDIEAAEPLLYRVVQPLRTDDGHTYDVMSVRENPYTAGKVAWLDLLDTNVVVIMIIMAVVSGIAMISGLLILILQRITTIGLLKAVGMTTARIQRTFLWYAAFIVVRGMLAGNALALLLLWLQARFRLVTLNPDSYYMDTVPVEFAWGWMGLVNAATFLLVLLALLLPTLIVSKVQPAKAIRFD